MLSTLTEIVTDRGAACLRAYFAEPPAPTYRGRCFETLAGGGDRDDVRDRITGDDLIATEMLSVEFPADARWDLIDGPLGAAIGAHLARIPSSVDIGAPAAAELLRDGNDADRAHVLLRDSSYATPQGKRRLGYVIAGKLLARKRPQLIPVYDSRIKCLLGRPPAFWLSLHERLTGDDGTLWAALIEAREEAGVAKLTSVLRSLDVILWMHHQQAYGTCSTTKTCDGFATVGWL